MNIEHKDKLNLDDIVEIVCDIENVNKQDVISKNRRDELIKARVLICHFGVEYLGESLTRVGEVINRNHATVYHHLWNYYYDLMFVPFKRDSEVIKQRIEHITEREYHEFSSIGTQKHISERCRRMIGI